MLVKETTATIGIFRSARRVYQRRAEKFEKRTLACSRRNKADSKCTIGNRTVFGSDRSEQRHCRINNGYTFRKYLAFCQFEYNLSLWFEQGSNYYVRILSTIDRELLKPSASVALHKHSNALVDILPPESDSSITMLSADEKPDVSYADIGGLDIQKQEMREAVELPLTHFELYKQIGIDPPRGVLMYGPPGCGKTMLAKAVAHHTTGIYSGHFYLGFACFSHPIKVLFCSSRIHQSCGLGIRTEISW